MHMVPSPASPSHPVVSPELAREMAAAFGWREPTEAELETAYASQRCDEQAMLDAYPGLLDRPDAELIDLIADPPAMMRDADEVVAVAAIILQRRLAGVVPWVA